MLLKEMPLGQITANIYAQDRNITSKGLLTRRVRTERLSPLHARPYTMVLISPYPDQEGNKLKFLSEWREFPSAHSLAGKKKKT